MTGTDSYSRADLQSIPTLWGQRINEVFFRNLKLAKFFTDRSDEFINGGDVLYTIDGSTYTANTKTNGSEVTLQSPAETKQTVSVSTWKESSMLFEDREYAQMMKSPALQRSYFEGAAQSVARSLDDSIATLFASFTNSVGVSTSNATLSTLMEAIAVLSAADVPGVDTGSEDVAFILHPYTAYRQVGILDNFVRYDAMGKGGTTSPFTTRIIGINVLVTAAVPNVSGTSGRYNLLAHRDSIHWARLNFNVKADKGYVGTYGVRVQQSYIHANLGELITADLCYGTAINRSGAAVKILSHATYSV